MIEETLTPIKKLPFPWFGGKSLAAERIWAAFGDTKNYVEPFAGGLATLLRRPGYRPSYHTETINDIDCYVSNFWRAVQADPDGVLQYADQPVNEADLQARHQWLVDQGRFRETIKTDPDYYHLKIAGWWVWGVCSWIGSGWCDTSRGFECQPNGRGVHRKIPHIGGNGRGVHRQIPHMGGNGRGVHRQIPHIGDNGQGKADLAEYLHVLGLRLRRVRVACGDWSRVLGPSPTHRIGITSVLLDPPYVRRGRTKLYDSDEPIAKKVSEWAIANGENPKLRIVLCGHADDYEMPGDWRCVHWRRSGGYASQGPKQKHLRDKECLWLSPACLGPS